MTRLSAMPDPDEGAALVAETEAYLADRAAPPMPPVPPGESPEGGVTRRVRRLQAVVDEAHQLAALQDDDTPLVLDGAKVRRRRRAAHQAARLHRLGQDPAMRAWQAARMRRILLAAALTSLTLALGWSTAGVQVFASEGADGGPRWWFAWAVEPFLSLALLTIVGAKAFMGVRGQPIRSKTLTRIEGLFLALTVGMNGWPHLPGIAARFTVSGLVLHTLGPVVAVAIVTALPIILAAFAGLSHGTPGEARTATIRAAQIWDDLHEHDDPPDDPPHDVSRIKSAAHARRAAGEQSRRRVAQYMAAHPDHTIEQIAAALDVSPATVKRHRRAITHQDDE